MSEDERMERLAAAQHAIWARWMRYLFDVSMVNDDGSVTIPAEKVRRWWDQMILPYSALSEREKQSDRDQVPTVLKALEPHAREGEGERCP